MKSFLDRIKKIFYWISGAVVHSAMATLVVGLGIGIVAVLVEQSCKIIRCGNDIERFINSPGGILVGTGIVVGVYNQFRQPFPISKADISSKDQN